MLRLEKALTGNAFDTSYYSITYHPRTGAVSSGGAC